MAGLFGGATHADHPPAIPNPQLRTTTSNEELHLLPVLLTESLHPGLKLLDVPSLDPELRLPVEDLAPERTCLRVNLQRERHLVLLIHHHNPTLLQAVTANELVLHRPVITKTDELPRSHVAALRALVEDVHSWCAADSEATGAKLIGPQAGGLRGLSNDLWCRVDLVLGGGGDPVKVLFVGDGGGQDIVKNLILDLTRQLVQVDLEAVVWCTKRRSAADGHLLCLGESELVHGAMFAREGSVDV